MVLPCRAKPLLCRTVDWCISTVAMSWHRGKATVRYEPSVGITSDAMSRELVNAICRTFPGAEVSDPWGGGHDAWKVGGKMFACIGAVMPGVSVKTDSIETAQMLIDVGVGVKAPYFHRSWVNLPWGTSEEELRHRLAASYRLVRSSLTRKAQAQLDPLK
jgi:predicted DNA-binding protein (MmcQ/YjbR family)